MENEIKIFAKLPSNQSSSATSKKSRSNNRTRETEEEAIIRRYHDAQRMARFRARKKKALEEQQLRLRLLEIANERCKKNNGRDDSESDGSTGSVVNTEFNSKYSQLLMIIEKLGRDVRLSYAGSRSSAERLKSEIGRAKALVRDCLIETSVGLRYQ